MCKRKLIGLCGGSFDPIHYGHLALAKQAFDELNLSEVIFIPTKKQPFKLSAIPANSEDRLNMLKLAINKKDYFSISSMEIQREGISYTADTLLAFKKAYPKNTDFFFIMGADSFKCLESWKNVEYLLSNCNFAVGIRNGTALKDLEEVKFRINQAYGTNVVFLNNKKLEISSTTIKEKINLGESLKGLLPIEVENYINEKELYRK